MNKLKITFYSHKAGLLRSGAKMRPLRVIALSLRARSAVVAHPSATR